MSHLDRYPLLSAVLSELKMEPPKKYVMLQIHFSFDFQVTSSAVISEMVNRLSELNVTIDANNLEPITNSKWFAYNFVTN